MARLKAFGAFWYDFIVGDDWRVACGVVVALAATYGLSRTSLATWWIVPAAVVVLLPSSLWRATRTGAEPWGTTVCVQRGPGRCTQNAGRSARVAPACPRVPGPLLCSSLGRLHTNGPLGHGRIASMNRTATRSVLPAAGHDLIRVHGARVNNLKDISVEIPKRRLTVFTGVSGSGKSSLVFGTIAAESQRLINETYSAFVQGFMPTLARPDVDVLDGLTTAIIVDQERMGADPRSTVGTATDANAMLRILFSRLGKPHIGSPAGVLLQRRLDQRGRRGHHRARRPARRRSGAASASSAACARAARAAARSTTST